MRLLVGLALALAALAVLFGFGWPTGNAGLPPRAVQAERVRDDHPRRLLYGINPALARWYQDPKKGRDWEKLMLDRIAEACGTIIRTGFDWAQIEPDPPVDGRHTYRWEDFDHIVDAANARGLAIVGLIVTSPPWANGDQAPEDVHLYPPTEEHAEAYIDFVTALARRYQGRVRYYEFWNEANACGWAPACASEKDAKAMAYLPWLKITYEAIKTVDPAARVAVTGLDLLDTGYLGYVDALYDFSLHRAECDEKPCRDGPNYLPSLTCRGLPCWDAIAVHPYNEAGAISFDRIDAVRRHMRDHGDFTSTVWVTEYGWSSVERHADYLEDSLERLNTPAFEYVELATYVVIADGPQTRGHGLVDADLNPKSVFAAFSGRACGASGRAGPPGLTTAATPFTVPQAVMPNNSTARRTGHDADRDHGDRWHWGLLRGAAGPRG